MELFVLAYNHYLGWKSSLYLKIESYKLNYTALIRVMYHLFILCLTNVNA